jgi:hypothetical protein
MKLFLAISFLLLFISQIKVSKVRTFLFFVLSVSCFSNLIIADDIPFTNFASIFTILLIVVFFSLLIFCLFPTVRLSIDFSNIIDGRINLSKLLVAACVPMVLVNLYILYQSYLFILAGDMSMTAFKNEGHSSTLISSLFPSFVSPIIRVISLMGWFCLIILVVNILKKQYFLSFLALIGSFNIPLMGLIAFSRSGIIYYLFSILILWITFEKYMEQSFAHKMRKVFFTFFVVVTTLFFYITYERFSDYSYWWVYEQSGSDVNIVIFSIIYYFTSWIDNTIILLTESFPPIFGKFNGYFSFPYYVISAFGFETESKSDVWLVYFNEYSTLFVGLFLDTLFDMGIFGFCYYLIMLMFFRIYLKSISINFSSYILLTVFVSQYFALFFAGNIFSYFFFSAALIICFITIKLCKTKYFKI